MLWHEDSKRSMIQNDRVQSRLTHICGQGQLIVTKRAKAVQRGEDNLLTNGGTSGLSYTKKVNLDPYLIPYKRN